MRKCAKAITNINSIETCRRDDEALSDDFSAIIMSAPLVVSFLSPEICPRSVSSYPNAAVTSLFAQTHV